MNGKVYLVGAGPGDPDLLTLKALRLLRSADVVLYDDLVASEILQLIPTATRVQSVGKRCRAKSMRQEEINFLLVTLAGSGLVVVRLKSGDPLIFGRAGEEIEALQKSNIEYEIVPGVTSALGAAAAAGIPLTHRKRASTLVLTTGQRAPGHEDLDWAQIASSEATLVIYMPGHDYTGITARLMTAGFAAETPCALISHATTSKQRVHITTVALLHRAPVLAAPTLLIVGDVVKCANCAAEGDEIRFPIAEAPPQSVAPRLLPARGSSHEELPA
jgi:uroporphyrin-III C-methyltransferase